MTSKGERLMTQEIEIYRDKLISGFDGLTCRVSPSLMQDGKGRAFILYGKLSLTGADVFLAPEIACSTDGGATFSETHTLQVYEKVENGIRTICGVDTTLYHKNTDKWVCLGRTTHYANDKHCVMVNGMAVTEPYYFFFDPDKLEFTDIIPLPFPYETISVIPFGQPIIYEDGKILLSFYFVAAGDTKGRLVSILYSFDGEKLEIVKSGTPLISPEGKHARGYCEPSMARLGDKYYLTIRTDDTAYLAVSDNGLDFAEPMAWVFDDGEKIESRNTQQRWVRFDDALYLAYTRITQYNGHIFRNRAPLFIARFDPARLCLIRESERVLVPEMGARLGNFHSLDVNRNEAWVSVGEWMQSEGRYKDEWKTCVRYGSDNTVWRVRVVKN